MRFPEPVVILRGPGKDQHGDPLLDTEPERIDTVGAYADGGGAGRGGSGEDTTTRGATVTSQATLYLPHGTDLRRTDRVEVRGRTWEVDGDPAHWTSPLTGRSTMTVATLKIVRG